jgi:hypothetical protein
VGFLGDFPVPPLPIAASPNLAALISVAKKEPAALARPPRPLVVCLEFGKSVECARSTHERRVMSHRIEIEPCGLGHRGQLYRVHYADAVLVESSRNPEFDGARALAAKGTTGRVEVWRRGGTSRAMGLDIERAARLTVKEDDKGGLRFVRWQPHPEQARENAVSCRPVESRTAKNQLAATYPPEKKSAVFDRSLRPNLSFPLDPGLLGEV